MINAFDILKLYSSIAIKLHTINRVFIGPKAVRPSIGIQYVQYKTRNIVVNNVSPVCLLKISNIKSKEYYFLPIIYGNFLLMSSIMPICKMTAIRKYIIVISP